MRRTLNHYALLTGGWASLAAGMLILPIPVPLPFPLAPTLLLTGSAILTVQSRSFRHGMQFARFRYRWLSRTVDVLAARAPARVRRLVNRTRPDLIVRRNRMRARHAVS